MSRRLPISGVPAPEGSPSGGLGEEIWSRGRTFLEIVESAGAAAQGLDAAFRAVHLPEALEHFYRSFPRRARIVALAHLQEQESLRLLAQAERLFSLGTSLWMRTFSVTEDTLVTQRYRSGRLPLFILFGDDGAELGRWEPRVATEETPPRQAPPASRPSDDGAALARELAQILAPYAGLPLP